MRIRALSKSSYNSTNWRISGRVHLVTSNKFTLYEGIKLKVTITEPFQLHEWCKKVMKVPSRGRDIPSGLEKHFPSSPQWRRPGFFNFKLQISSRNKGDRSASTDSVQPTNQIFKRLHATAHRSLYGNDVQRRERTTFEFNRSRWNIACP